MSRPDTATLERRVRVAARTLARHALVQAWGHCSARIDARTFLVCAPKAMACIGVDEPGTVVSIDAALPPGVLGEVRIHQQTYRLRPDVAGICRIMPPVTMALSTLGLVPRPRHGVGAFNAACRFRDDPRLLRDDALAEDLARQLGDAPALVMRANGAVTVAGSIELAVCLAWCLEDAARIEHLVRSACTPAMADSSGLSAAETRARQVSSGAVFERLWQHLSNGDPEAVAGDAEFPDIHWGTQP